MEKKEKRKLVYDITNNIIVGIFRENSLFIKYDIKNTYKQIFREIEKAVNELEDEDIEEDTIGDGLPI